MTAPEPVPALEIGGTHVTAAQVHLDTGRVGPLHRLALDSSGTADAIVDTLVEAAHRVGPRGRAWGVAIPGPFEYATGIARFADVGKFDQLFGVDLGAALRARLGSGCRVHFVNDAEAFGVGEAVYGVAREHRRLVCLTVGTGIGSAFMLDGRPVSTGPEVPSMGYAYLLTWEGRPLEETVSARAIRRRYAGGGGPLLDVDGIAARARVGDELARRVFSDSFTALGSCLGPWVRRFGATAVVVGGAIAGAFDLFEPALCEGLERAGADVAVHPSLHADTSALLGAALATR